MQEKKEKNIAIIVTSLNGGGAERIAGLLSRELSKIYNVYLFLLSTENIVYEYGGTIVDIGKSGPFYEYPIKKYKKIYKIDVSISFLEIMNFANVRTKGNDRIILSERSVQSLIIPSMDSQTYKIKKYYPFSDDIVTCSYGVKYDLENNYGIDGNITTIYNFVDKEHITEKSKETISQEAEMFLNGSPYFLAVGRLHDQKNHRRLIKQFSLFHKENKEIKLLIIGDGDLKDHLEKEITSLSLDKYVKLIPYTNNPFPYIKKSKALIVSSKYEGLPNIILEAMSMGCVIVSTDCLAGPRELLADINDYNTEISDIYIGKRGILVRNDISEDTGDTTYLSKAMKLVSKTSKMTDDMIDAQTIYMNNYTNENILKQWISLIESKKVSKEVYIDKDVDQLKLYKNVYIYGAGLVGTSYYLRLKDSCNFKGFVVTNNTSGTKEYLGQPLFEVNRFPYDFEKSAFIIGVGDNSQDEVIKTLKEHGANFFLFPMITPISYDFFIDGEYDLKEELCNWYKVITGKDIDIEHPVSYNEKLQWLKLYDNKPIKKILVDKIAVREYIKKTIGEKYLIPILGEWKSYDDIDFDRLPNKFALKCNNGSGTNIIVKDKKLLNHKENRQKFNAWQRIKYEYLCGFELQYAEIESKIYAEKLIESEDGEDLKDFKVFVFNGKAKLVQVDIDRQHRHRRNLYTPEWTYLPYSILYPTDSSVVIQKPKCLDEMITIAQKLAGDFIHARVDFYISKNELFFGEITFTHGSGTERFDPPEFEIEMGRWMKLGV